MFNAFGRTPVLSPCTVRRPQVDLWERNTEQSPFAAESMLMNFAEYDRAPEDALNRVLWAVAKPGVAYPPPIHGAIFTTAPEAAARRPGR